MPKPPPAQWTQKQKPSQLELKWTQKQTQKPLQLEPKSMLGPLQRESELLSMLMPSRLKLKPLLQRPKPQPLPQRPQRKLARKRA
jgi:hypothetical protein